MFDLLQRYPDAENQLEILKKDYLGVDNSSKKPYIKIVNNEEGNDERSTRND